MAQAAVRIQTQRTSRDTIMAHHMDSAGRVMIGADEEISAGESLTVVDISFEDIDAVLPPGRDMHTVEQDAGTGQLRLRNRRRGPNR